MYLDYFELSKFPFRTNPDPAFLWFSEKHKEALSLLKYGIMKRDGFLLLIGGVGTGKTTLIKYLLQSTDASTIVATISNPMVDIIDFYNLLFEKFDFNKKISNKADFLIHFNEFLLAAYSAHKLAFLVIDEAQTLNHDRLEEIRILSNIELNGQKMLNICFVGESETETFMMDPKNRPTRTRINTIFRLQPLDVSHRI